jgi:hypothetical protein
MKISIRAALNKQRDRQFDMPALKPLQGPPVKNLCSTQCAKDCDSRKRTPNRTPNCPCTSNCMPICMRMPNCRHMLVFSKEFNIIRLDRQQQILTSRVWLPNVKLLFNNSILSWLYF